MQVFQRCIRDQTRTESTADFARHLLQTQASFRLIYVTLRFILRYNYIYTVDFN